jgi:hypothetical protein
VDLYATRDGKAVEDLQAGDVEVLEDGVRQAVDSFEFVRVRPPVAQELRAEPSNVEASRQMASDPRARIFVIFLDTYHTQIEGSAQMRRPLLNFVDRVVGQDDLVALMTPEMSAADVTLGRKTTVVSRLLEQRWDWGRRGRLVDDDPVERLYDACFFGADAAIATEMKARRRERLTLDAIDDLIVHFGGLRDERKAVLVVTEGWIGYGPNPVLARATDNDRGTATAAASVAAASATPTGLHSPTWITRSGCRRQRSAPTGSTCRSIRCMRAGWRCSTPRLVPIRRRRWHRTPPTFANGRTDFACWPRTPTASPW